MTDIIADIPKEVAITDNFIEALFAISEKIHTREMYRKRTNGSGRWLWHVTKADLMLMCTLHKTFNSNGKIENVSKHMLYKKLCDLYEDPCSMDQFYMAFDKFETVGLLESSGAGLVNEFALNHFINPDSNKISRLVIAHPFVFSKAFTDLPVGSQKLFFDLIRKAGNDKKGYVFYWLSQKAPIFELLHRTHPYEIKILLNTLQNSSYEGEQVISSWSMDEKKGTQVAKLHIFVNQNLLRRYEYKKSYRDPLPGKATNRKIITRLRCLLKENWLADFEYANNGLDFKCLVNQLKGKGYKMIKYVVAKLREAYEKNRVYPENILDLISTELKSRIMVDYLEIAKRTGIYKFISPNRFDDNRLYEFASAASKYTKKEFISLCNQARRTLEQHFTAPPVDSLSSYAQSHMLGDLIDINTVRRYALDLNKDPEAYKSIEFQAEHMAENRSITDLRAWMIRQIELLPRWELKVDIPSAFKVEEFVTKKIAVSKLPFFEA